MTDWTCSSTQTTRGQCRCDRVRDARLHDARHTAATAMLVLGIDARTVMGLLGWSQLSLTQRYQHLVPELAADAAARIADSIWTTAG